MGYQILRGGEKRLIHVLGTLACSKHHRTRGSFKRKRFQLAAYGVQWVCLQRECDTGTCFWSQKDSKIILDGFWHSRSRETFAAEQRRRGWDLSSQWGNMLSHNRPKALACQKAVLWLVASTATCTECCRWPPINGTAPKKYVNPSNCRGRVQGQLKPDSASSCPTVLEDSACSIQQSKAHCQIDQLLRFCCCGCRRIKHMKMFWYVDNHNEVKDAAENHGILLFLPMTQMKKGTQHDNQRWSCQPE